MKIKHRLKSVLFYIGFTPFFPRFLFSKNKQNDVSNEYFNALAIQFILNLTALIGLLAWIFGNQAFLKFFPEAYTKLSFSGNHYILFSPIIIMFCAGLIILFIYIFRILSGMNIRITLINKITKNIKILKISYFMNLSFIIFIISTSLITIHANILSQNIKKPAKVYMLYDDMGFVPHWIFPLGFYRIQRAAIDKWGKGHVAIVPISKESLKEAKLNAEMIFLSVHGGDGFFYFANKTRSTHYKYGPNEVQEIGKGENLKFVYLGNCYGGILKGEWASAFYPAKIKTYDTFSLYPEHLYWLWIKLPNILKDIN